MGALTLNDFEVLKQSRGENKRGRQFRGVRVFKIPTDLQSTYEDDYEPNATNFWPDTASTWLVTTDYVVDDEVLGDGAPNSYHYVCILNNGPGGVGAKEPPNATYWTRVKSTSYINEHRVEKEYPAQPGNMRVTSWYKNPSRRRLLRDNLGKGMIEATVGFQMVRQRRENNGSTTRVIEGAVQPDTWLVGTAYTVGLLVRGNGTNDKLPYICIKNSTGDIPPDSEFWELYDGKYKVIEGTNMYPKATATVKILSATADIALNTEIALLGKYNNAQLTNIGSVAAKTLLYMGYFTRLMTQENDISDQTRLFWYDPAGWGKTCDVQRFRKIVQQMRVKDVNGEVLPGQFARVTSWLTDKDEEERDPTLGPADFSAFNNMVDWDS